jgi:hypothetical protein
MAIENWSLVIEEAVSEMTDDKCSMTNFQCKLKTQNGLRWATHPRDANFNRT